MGWLTQVCFFLSFYKSEYFLFDRTVQVASVQAQIIIRSKQYCEQSNLRKAIEISISQTEITVNHIQTNK